VEETLEHRIEIAGRALVAETDMPGQLAIIKRPIGSGWIKDNLKTQLEDSFGGAIGTKRRKRYELLNEARPGIPDGRKGVGNCVGTSLLATDWAHGKPDFVRRLERNSKDNERDIALDFITVWIKDKTPPTPFMLKNRGWVAGR
jgi:hypothetical protein